MSKTDSRFYSAAKIELREGDGPPRLEGMAVPYGVAANIHGPRGFTETIAPRAFREYLEGGGDVVYNYGHVPHQVLARRNAGTLDVREDDSGVYVSLELPDTQLGRDVAVMVRRGDASGQSIEFTTARGGDEWAERGGKLARTVHRGGLPGVALVARPAYPQTTVAMRSLEQWQQHHPVMTPEAAQLRLAEARMRGYR